MKLEKRVIYGLSLREAEQGSGYIGVLEGYAAVFESNSIEFGSYGKPWVERIKPGAFTRSLSENSDIKALWSHRDDAVMARTPATLTVEEDDNGLRVEMRLIDTTLNRDVLASVRGGLIDAMSFGFIPKKTSWEEGETRDTRTLEDVDLFEVSAVAWPAYPDSSISARSAIRHYTDGIDLTVEQERSDYFEAQQRAKEANQVHLRNWGQRLQFLSRSPART